MEERMEENKKRNESLVPFVFPFFCVNIITRVKNNIPSG